VSVRWGNPVPLVAVIYCTHPEPSDDADDDTPPPRTCPLCGVTMGRPRLPDQERVEVRGL
jgi:hypothetical protein